MEESEDFSYILLEKSLKDLTWLKDEFNLLFKRENFPTKDINLAKKVLNYFIENLMLHQDEVFLEKLSKTLRKIKYDFPQIFN